MKKLFHILFDTAWGPAVAWLVVSVLACLAFTLLQTSNFLVVLPVLLAALVVLAAFVLSLVRRHWLRALLQLLLVVAAQVATGGAYVPLLHLLHCRSTSAPTEDFDEARFGEKQWELVRETGLDFPEGARGLRLFCDYRCAFDCSCAARIALPGDAATAIAVQLEKLPAKQEQVSGLRTQELDWWPQDAASRRLERYFNWEHGLVWAFLHDEEDCTILYLYWFTV